MSRTANGWIPSAKYQLDDIAEEIEVEDSEASLSWDRYQGIGVETSPTGLPGSVINEVSSQMHAWQGEWACRKDSEQMPPVVWPEDMGPLPEPLMVDHLRKALLTFPVQL